MAAVSGSHLRDGFGGRGRPALLSACLQRSQSVPHMPRARTGLSQPSTEHVGSSMSDLSHRFGVRPGSGCTLPGRFRTFYRYLAVFVLIWIPCVFGPDHARLFPLLPEFQLDQRGIGVPDLAFYAVALPLVQAAAPFAGLPLGEGLLGFELLLAGETQVPSTG